MSTANDPFVIVTAPPIALSNISRKWLVADSVLEPVTVPTPANCVNAPTAPVPTILNVPLEKSQSTIVRKFDGLVAI